MPMHQVQGLKRIGKGQAGNQRSLEGQHAKDSRRQQVREPHSRWKSALNMLLQVSGKSRRMGKVERRWVKVGKQ